MSYKGIFKPKNPSKYIGDHTNIIYRSLWERKFMVFCDNNSNVIKWCSEEIAIPYLSPVDGKYHRYFVDFLVEMETKTGKEVFLIEIKPKRQCVEPKRGKRTTRNYLKEMQTWKINNSKWIHAKNFATQNNWKFKILTEDDLNIK
jgi:hypothetical protein